MAPQYAVPMFGGDGYSRSPFAMADDFTAWLFNESQLSGAPSAMNYHGPGEMSGVVGNAQNFSLQAPFFTHDPLVSGHYPQPAPPPTRATDINSLMNPHMQKMTISDERWHELIDLIESRFNDTSHAPVRKKNELLAGVREDDHHVLSVNMMHTYINSYWLHFHPQMPILHRPTFGANTCPSLLLIAIMALGASCLEKSHGFDTTRKDRKSVV